MSDTTITAEERAQWRAESRHEYTYFSTDGTRLILALDALEQAEARAERAESAQLHLCQWLSDIAVELGCDCDNEAMLLAVHDVKGRAEQAEARADFANNVLQSARDCILSGDPTSDVGLFLECDEFDKKLLVDIAVLRTRAEKAEANVARLTKMVDWLAQVLTGYGDENEEMSAADWKEAARRSVAAVEEPCQK